MSPQQILQDLLDLVRLSRDAGIGTPTGPATITDWFNLVLSDPVQSNAKELLDRAVAANYDDAIAALQEKHDAKAPTLEAFAALALEEQIQVLAITNAIVVLRGKNEAVALGKSPTQWLAENVLPMLQTALPILLTLI